MDENFNVVFYPEPKYDALQLVDVPAVIAACSEKWLNQTLCTVNGSVLRLGVFNDGTIPWHTHDDADEFFFVLQGELFIETENERFRLGEHQGMTVPKGVLHRPVIEAPAVALMIENVGAGLLE